MYPRLPKDLEHIIFVLAAIQTREAESILFRSLLIQTVDFLDADPPLRAKEEHICRAVMDNLFVAKHVKFVGINLQGKQLGKVLPFLTSLPRITDLAIWSEPVVHVFPDLFRFTNLSYLSLNSFSSLSFCQFLLAHPRSRLNITLLEVNVDAISALVRHVHTRLPKLSHLCVSTSWYDLVLGHKLKSFTPLVEMDQMSIILLAVITNEALPFTILERYPILSHPKVSIKSRSIWANEWRLRVEGKPDIWSRAALIVPQN
ncbi:hypothetical protein DL96DRAFT_1631548 [Flagelloscypha sp. PMI_526]|nr:hypothetical protein DL96DRAFT_1631548 [Flagelloscypha sp. PMI_526]